jgi:hypothetical protein
MIQFKSLNYSPSPSSTKNYKSENIRPELGPAGCWKRKREENIKTEIAGGCLFLDKVKVTLYTFS